MSDVETVLQALPRILDACRSRSAPGAEADREISDNQVMLLSQLDVTDPVMVTELARHVGVTASTMSLNLKRLREAGYVTSERDPADRRVMNVLLTERGAAAREALRSFSRVRVDALLRELTPEVRDRAVQGLVFLADAADRIAG